MKELKDKVALVVGGASGMGQATAIELAKEGCAVVIADIHAGRMAETRDIILDTGVECITLHCDIANDSDVDSMCKKSIEWRGHVDIVMITAGISVLGPPHTIPVEDWQRLLDINVLGTIRVCNAIMPHLLQRGSGHLVNTSSIAGKIAYSHTASAYVASKHAVDGYTEALAIYAKAKGVGVSCLIPGFIATNFGDHAVIAGTDEPEKWFEMPSFLVDTAVEASAVGRLVVEGIKDERYQIYTHPELEKVVAEWNKNRDAKVQELSLAIGE